MLVWTVCQTQYTLTDSIASFSKTKAAAGHLGRCPQYQVYFNNVFQFKLSLSAPLCFEKTKTTFTLFIKFRGKVKNLRYKCSQIWLVWFFFQIIHNCLMNPNLGLTMSKTRMKRSVKSLMKPNLGNIFNHVNT